MRHPVSIDRCPAHNIYKKVSSDQRLVNNLQIVSHYIHRYYPRVRVESFEGKTGEPLNAEATEEWHWVYCMKSDLAQPVRREAGGGQGRGSGWEEASEEEAKREQQEKLRDRVENLIKAACWRMCGQPGDEGTRSRCVIAFTILANCMRASHRFWWPAHTFV